MHSIEPYYSWRQLYIACEDERSPFYGREYSEFEFTHAIYNYLIHPQWDEIGSATLFVKVLFVDYEKQFCIIELFGEWNDTLYNDISFLKRQLIDRMTEEGINRFLLIGENILSFHAGDNDYYSEWFDDVEEGWIVGLNFRDHVLEEFVLNQLDYYIAFGGGFDAFNWRSLQPLALFERIEMMVMRRLGEA
ncbi:MAG: hypothetical protein K8R63_02170 [Bacteroidales bacterium]|nr:hypothetical protein [Bacteroidales bacterium]